MNKEVKKEEGKKDIEVELKYQPTEEQMGKILEKVTGPVIREFTDEYFDYEDFELLEKGVRLRKRNNNFELKLKSESKYGNREINDLEEINKYLGGELEKLIESGKIKKIAKFSTLRKEYKKEFESTEMIIDVDELDFGEGQEKYNICEIEIMTQEGELLEKEAKKKIKKFAKEIGCESVDSGKLKEYMRRFCPDIYQDIYIDRKSKEIKKEKKILEQEIKMR